MALFALVFNGIISQLSATAFPVAAPIVWTGDISAVTPAPQAGWTATETAGSWTFTAPAAPAPTLAQQAATAMAAGITLTLSGSLVLSATAFPTDPTTQTKLAAVITTINTTGDFPGGATTYPMKDASGAWHTLTLAQYKAIAAAIAGYAAALDLIIDGNPLGVTALPTPSASLTLT